MPSTLSYSGLSKREVQAQLHKFGYNEIPAKRDYKLLKIFLNQFNSFLVLLLIAAGGVSIALGELVDGVAIMVIVLLNAIIGFTQEYKAEDSVKKLKKMVVQTCVVVRNGQQIAIPIRELVPDDIIIINEGDKIPADMELLEGFSLNSDESMLTGESMAVEKQSGDPLYSGTIVNSGRGVAKVQHTGTNTEFGKIIGLLQKNDETKSPLSRQLDQLGKKIGFFTIILITLLFLIGYLRGVAAIEMMMTSVALGVSAIPEGMPIIVTLTLAIGVQILARKKAIVRKMNAIETLGATTVICSDKTGTLTLNEMTATIINTNFQEREVSGRGYKVKKGETLKNISEEEKILFQICSNCNNAYIDKQILGDPTEIALKVLSKKAKQDKEFKQLDEKVFTSARKMMSSYHQLGKRKVTYSKGAYEEILKCCSYILKNGKKVKLSATDKKKIKDYALKYSEQALRVLAFAYKEGKFEEKGLVFVGLVGIIDPPRKTVAQSLALAQQAGIKVKIITGDHAVTAKAIGEKIGLKVENVIIGEEIDKLNDRQLLKVINQTQIFARTKPEHKYRIVDLLQKNHEVVAVTGDGVNDAPALKHADVGIAMGIKSTEASKEVADIVLKDDNFSTIVKTIEEGRRIYHNILAFIKYMLSANFITLFLVAVVTIAGYPLPILALQVLWLNVATDALPALALGRSPATRDMMSEKPHPKNENIFHKFISFILTAMVIQVIVNLGIYAYGLHLDQLHQIDSTQLDLATYTRTLVFTQTVIFELFFAFVCKEEKSVSLKSLKSNHFLIGAAAISLCLQLIVLYFEPAQLIFKTIPLGFSEWLIVLICAASAFIVPSIHKLIFKNAL